MPTTPEELTIAAGASVVFTPEHRAAVGTDRVPPEDWYLKEVQSVGRREFMGVAYFETLGEFRTVNFHIDSSHAFMHIVRDPYADLVASHFYIGLHPDIIEEDISGARYSQATTEGYVFLRAHQADYKAYEYTVLRPMARGVFGAAVDQADLKERMGELPSGAHTAMEEFTGLALDEMIKRHRGVALGAYELEPTKNHAFDHLLAAIKEERSEYAERAKTDDGWKARWQILETPTAQMVASLENTPEQQTPWAARKAAAEAAAKAAASATTQTPED